MKFHPPSFVIGFASALALVATRQRLRPVVLELSSLTLHFGRLVRSVLGRGVEDAVDFVAEITEKADARLRVERPLPAGAARRATGSKTTRSRSSGKTKRRPSRNLATSGRVTR